MSERHAGPPRYTKRLITWSYCETVCLHSKCKKKYNEFLIGLELALFLIGSRARPKIFKIQQNLNDCLVPDVLKIIKFIKKGTSILFSFEYSLNGSVFVCSLKKNVFTDAKPTVVTCLKAFWPTCKTTTLYRGTGKTSFNRSRWRAFLFMQERKTW